MEGSDFENVMPVPWETLIEVGSFGEIAYRHPRWHPYDIEDYVRAVNVARTVRGMSFDVVDVPDYNSFGRYLRFAFEREGVIVGRYVQALHGRVSDTYLQEWFKIGTVPNRYDHARRRAEDLSLASLDSRYGLSEFYVKQLQEQSHLKFTTIDPLLCVSIPEISTLPEFSPHTAVRPVFIGRLERRKGADLFAHLLWDLGPDAAKRALIVGSEIRLGGISAREKLFAYLRARGLSPEYRDAMSHAELTTQIFRKPSVVALPSRMDQFNLIALEAVLHGCPVLIGAGAAAASILPRRFPGLPIRVLSEAAWDRGADDLREMLAHFDKFRRLTIEALQANPPVPDRSGLPAAYEAMPSYSAEARHLCRREFDDISRLESLCIRGGGSVPALLPTPAPSPNGQAPRVACLRRLDDPAELRRFVADSLSVTDAPNTTPEMLEDKRARLRALVKASPYLFRTHLLVELADVEEQLGNSLVAAAYRARVLRWLDGDRLDVLDSVRRTLCQAGLGEEAKAITLHSNGRGHSADQDEVFEYLERRFQRYRTNDIDDEWTVEFERHTAEGYRASVIVSNYRVPADRFSRFLRLLGRSDMIRRREAELIVIDSGSPVRQWDLNGAEVRACGLDLTFVRTPKRETIQRAWNRGIELARGQYLAFLGTDEALRPDALDRLACCLDADSGVDWAMGDSFISAVDGNGAPVVDKLAYLRGGMTHASLLFDCTYLSYVGGLYRRSLHDRFGYYDESFRGAGDTEFKCRLHPYLTFRHIPETLGMFLDYPSERTTNSPWVEIEDTRAWYIFRTPGGIRYLYRDASQERLEEAFWGSLANRRCYTDGPESDVALAWSILRRVAEQFPASPLVQLAPSLKELLRTLEAIGTRSDWSHEGEREFLRQLRASERTFYYFQKLRPDLIFPADLTADARFFAHTWLWE
jgi:glycosyltransferase involved in cell wall biosynthesis